MPFLPPDFAVPARAQTPRFTLRMLSIHEVVKDFDAVMSSREHLWARFGSTWGWPAADLTLEQDLIDLAWHQKEFQLRSAFALTVIVTLTTSPRVRTPGVRACTTSTLRCIS